MKGFLIGLLLTMAVPAYAQLDPSVFKAYLGANAVTFDGHSFPSDFEIGGAGRASMSPHLSAVGSLFYGVNHAYLTAALGGRVTVSDVDRQDFSIGVGIQYHASSQLKVRPEEWAPDVTIGWTPWPSMPKWILGAQAGYGLETKQVFGLAAVRYALGPI